MQRRLSSSESDRPRKRSRIIAQETTPVTPEAIDHLTPLPTELQTHIMRHLPLNSIGRVHQTSRHLHGFLSHTSDLKILIERDCGIPLQTLTLFTQLVEEIEPGLTICFATVYQHLRRLIKKAEKNKIKYPENSHFIYSCLQSRYHLSLLAICLNQSSATLLEKCIPRDEKVMWLSIAIFAHVNNNLLLLSDINSTLPPTTKDLIFLKICHSDNPLLVSFLFDPIYHFNFVPELPEEHEYMLAARAGNRVLLQTFIERFGCQPDWSVLCEVAASGSSEAFDYLTATFPLTCDSRTLFESGFSENPELVKHLVTQSGSNPDKFTFRMAAQTGNIAFVRQLIKDYNPQPDDEILLVAEGDEEFIEYLAGAFQSPFTTKVLNSLAHHCSPAKLVELIKKYGVLPDEETMRIIAHKADLAFLLAFSAEHRLQLNPETIVAIAEAIARSGRLDVLHELVNKFHPTLDEEVQWSACDSGNLEMIQFMADTFNLPLSETTLYYAEHAQNWYRVIRYHLEQVRVMIEEDKERDADENTVLLYRAAFAMQSAFTALQERGIETARAQLQLAALSSPRHFFAVAVRAALQPAAYRLDGEGVEVLVDAMRSATTLPVSIMEADEIYKCLSGANDERLQSMAKTVLILNSAPGRCETRPGYIHLCGRF